MRRWRTSSTDDAEAIMLINKTSATLCCNQINSDSDFCFSWSTGSLRSCKSWDGQIITEQETVAAFERKSTMNNRAGGLFRFSASCSKTLKPLLQCVSNHTDCRRESIPKRRVNHTVMLMKIKNSQCLRKGVHFGSIKNHTFSRLSGYVEAFA